MGATGLVIACGGDDGGGGTSCEGSACDGGSNETSTPDGSQPQQDGSGSDGGADADAGADGTVIENCGDGGAAGTLDEMFGDGGMVWLDYAGAQGTNIAVQADGKIVVGGKTAQAAGTGFAVVRLMPDGTLDSTFGTNGLVETRVATSTHLLSALAVQGDGRIVGAGYARSSGQPVDIAALRYLPDGGSDPSFGDGGVVLARYTGRDACGSTLILLPGGQILIGGSSEDRIIQTAPRTTRSSDTTRTDRRTSRSGRAGA